MGACASKPPKAEEKTTQKKPDPGDSNPKGVTNSGEDKENKGGQSNGQNNGQGAGWTAGGQLNAVDNADNGRHDKGSIKVNVDALPSLDDTPALDERKHKKKRKKSKKKGDKHNEKEGDWGERRGLPVQGSRSRDGNMKRGISQDDSVLPRKRRHSFDGLRRAHDDDTGRMDRRHSHGDALKKKKKKKKRPPVLDVNGKKSISDILRNKTPTSEKTNRMGYTYKAPGAPLTPTSPTSLSRADNRAGLVLAKLPPLRSSLDKPSIFKMPVLGQERPSSS